MKRVKD
jgi:hypothetical protein